MLHSSLLQACVSTQQAKLQETCGKAATTTEPTGREEELQQQARVVSVLRALPGAGRSKSSFFCDGHFGQQAASMVST